MGEGKLDLAVAKCVIGQRSVGRWVYEKIIKDLIGEVEQLRADLDRTGYIPFGHYQCGGCFMVFRNKESHTCSTETLSEVNDGPK